MLRILIVDDDAQKVRRVAEAISALPGVDPDAIDVANTARDARVRLTSTAYDLLILDVALPERADLPPAADVGIALLKEVCSRGRYVRPKQIVGLTAFSDALERAEPDFTQELWHVISYSNASTEWVEALSKKIKYLYLSVTNHQALEYGSDLCIITALEVPEQSAILDLPWGWEFIEIGNEVATFRSGWFEVDGHRKRVIAACANRMGMTSAAILAMKAIYCFRPSLHYS